MVITRFIPNNFVKLKTLKASIKEKQELPFYFITGTMLLKHSTNYGFKNALAHYHTQTVYLRNLEYNIEKMGVLVLRKISR